ncbi:MAG: hypothetical protein ACOZCL_05945 [Bacillota bacterium]
MEKRLRESIDKGIDFLYKNQMLHGEFKTFISPDTHMKQNNRFVSTTYITTFVLYSLSFIKDSRIDKMAEKAAQFLLEEMEQPGIWRFFTVNRHARLSGGGLEYYTPLGIVPDLDVVAVVSYFLKNNEIEIPDNVKVFLDNRDEQGLYYTWLMDVPRREEYTDKTQYLLPRENDICSGVNTNILFYLGENKYTRPVCDYLNKLIIEDRVDGSYVYFPNSFTIYYLISRAYCRGAAALEQSRDKAVEKILEMLEADSTMSPLKTAYAICILQNYGIHGSIVEKAVRYLMDCQQADGSWSMETFYIGGNYFYGSEEFTTAICLEALSRYKYGCGVMPSEA